MTLGRLSAIDIGAGTNTLIYTVPERSGIFKATLNICNRNNSDADIRWAIVDGGVSDMTNADWIEYGVTIRAGGVVERLGLELTPGQSIVGYSDTSNVNFTVWA